MIYLLVLHTAFAVILSYGINIVLHELGHLAGGALTGWRFLYLQIGNIVVLKREEYQIKRMIERGCQCIMSPKSIHSKAGIYTLGGLAANSLLSMVSFLIMIHADHNIFLLIYSLSFFAAGIALLLLNGIPYTRRICNDMACFVLIKRSSTTSYSHNTQLLVAKKLMEGRTYREINHRLLILPMDIADNDILAYQALLEYYFYLDQDECGKAQQALCKIDQSSRISHNVHKIYRHELLFLQMRMDILKKETMKFETGYDQYEMEEYITQNKTIGDPHSLRVIGLWNAYQYYIVEDFINLIECLDATCNEIDKMNCIYPGERYFCLNQLFLIRNTIEKDFI